MGLRDRIKGRFSKSNESEEKVIKIGPHKYQETQLKEMLGMDGGNSSINTPYASKQDGVNYKSEYKWLFDPNRGVRWDFNPVRTRSLAQDDTWVQMLIPNITDEIAHTPGQIVENENPEVMKEYNPFERVSKNKTGKQSTSEKAKRAEQLMRNPNPDEDQSEFLTQAVADLLEVGSMAAVKMFPESAYDGDELTAADPKLIHIKTTAPETFTKDYREKTGMLKGFWQYDKNRGGQSNRGNSYSGPIEFSTEEIGWKDFNPRSNRRYGLPPTLSVQEFLELMDLTIDQEKRFWSRGALIQGFLATDGDADEIDALGGEVEEGKGKPEKGLLHVSDNDAKFIQVGVNWSELNMEERKEQYAKHIASAFQVPTSVVGIKPERVNRSTFRAERENFESNTLGPYMQKVERWVNANFIWPHFGRDIRWEFQPGMSEKQKASISERVTREWDSNLIKRSEARTQIGYSKIEEEDQDGFKEDLVSEPASPQDVEQLSLSNYVKQAEEDVFENIDEARRRAEQLGLDGWHPIKVDGERMYVPGKNPERYEEVTGKSILGKPFGPWEDFEGCVTFMQTEEGYSEEDAKRICGSLEAELKEEGDLPDTCRECGEKEREEGRFRCSDCLEGLDKKKVEKNHSRIGDDFVCVDEVASFERQEIEDGKCPWCGEEIELDLAQKDEPLRETNDWDEFGFQPSDVEEIKEPLQGEVEDFFKELAEHERFSEIVEAGAKEQKNSASLRRILKEILEGAALSQGIEEIVKEQTAEKAIDSLEATASATGLQVETDPVLERIKDRDLEFANNYSKRIEEEIRDTVSEGWQDGATTREIRENIKEQAEDFSDNQAEVIARDQLQRANGEARNSFAQQHSDKFVEEWITAGDNRVRPAHQAMNGKWKRPSEEFIVEYEGRGTAKESYPGDSKYGIQCRCDTLLKRKEEVDSRDHAGENL